MRFLFTLPLLITSFFVYSQTVTSPKYKEGAYRVDTVYQYYGDIPSRGIGGMWLAPSLEEGMVTGVDFILVIDSTNQGGSPQHAAYMDSLGTQIPIYKGDTIRVFPVNFKVFAGEIGFSVLLVGTPTVGGETYPCELEIAFTLGQDFYGQIGSSFENDCTVEPILSTEKSIKSTVSFYPNPASDYLQLNFQEASSSREINVLDSKGVEVARVDNIQSHSYLLNTRELQSGFYMLVVKNKQAIESRNTFVVE